MTEIKPPPSNPTPASNIPQPTKFTLRNPPNTYIHLNVYNGLNPLSSTSSGLDEITLRTHLTSALTQYLGITGTAIPLDILKFEGQSGEAWVRLPRDDERAVVAALSQWVGKGGVVVRVVNRRSWMGGLIVGTVET